MSGEFRIDGRKVAIDRPNFWIAVRATQFLLIVLFSKAIYLDFHTPGTGVSPWNGLLFILLFLLMPFHSISTGWADSLGIHYRRYFRLKFLAWADVKEIQWQGHKLRIRRKKRDSVFNRIVFLVGPFAVLSAYYSQRLGLDVSVPEVIESLDAIPKDDAVSIVVAPPVGKWLWRTFAGMCLLFLLIVLIRLVLAFLH
jgi:hypothetical protein